MKNEEKDLEMEKVEPRVLKKPTRSVSLKTCILIALVVALGAFAVGTRSTDILARLNNKDTPGRLDTSSLQEVYAALNAKFDGKLDPQKLIDGAKHGMVSAAGDPYTVYMSPDEAKEFNNGLNGTFEGIGAELGKKDDKLTVISTLDSSPAQKAGLMSGDVIVKVNNEDSADWAVDKAVTKIRGEKGTTVKLTILRGTETKEITITRAAITDPSVKSEITAGNIGVLKISRFDENTARLSRLAAEDFKAKGVKGVIVDLRGNGGGLRDSAVDIAGLWMNDKVVMTERVNGKVTETLKTDNNAILAGMPTVVLINGGSASASEILAGALKDNNVATLLGEKSFGKGSVQTIEQLSNGGVLKVTIARWYTPNGKNINKEGINPDTEVKITDEDVKAAKDTQKDAAIQKLQAGL